MQELRDEFAKIPKTGTPSAALSKALEHEIGDVLFSFSQLTRHLGLDSEQSLRVANARFESRYFNMRNAVEANGQAWDKLTDPEKELAWQQAKVRLADHT
jgi:ATP diphosphatase